MWATDAALMSQGGVRLGGMDAVHDIEVVPGPADRSTTEPTPPAPPPRRHDFDRRLLELGTRRQIEHRLAHHRLEGVHEAVYRVVGSPPTWHQQLVAACLSAAPVPPGRRSS